MKKIIHILFIFLVLGVTNLKSQDLSGCMGINFSESLTNVKSKMLDKKNFTFYKESDNYLMYTDGSFAGHQAVGVVFKFYQNKLHTIIVLLSVDNKPMVMSFYSNILSELESKYNLQPKTVNNFVSPYYEGDGHEASAIRGGYAELLSVFSFNDNKVIYTTITKELSVKLTYQDMKLTELDVNETKQNNYKDY